jgi:hypothetical protein
VAVVVVLLVVGQLVLPDVAGRWVREHVSRYGMVESVSVKAWPAVKLLWRDADEVKVRTGELRLTAEQAAGLVGEGKGTERVVASAESVQLGSVEVTDAIFRKQGERVYGEGTISEEDVRKALPAGVGVALVGSGGGQVEVRVSGELFGFGASVEAVAKAVNGKLVVEANAGLFGTVTHTLFADPRVYVRGVSAREVQGAAGEESSYRLSMWGRVR